MLVKRCHSGHAQMGTLPSGSLTVAQKPLFLTQGGLWRASSRPQALWPWPVSKTDSRQTLNITYPLSQPPKEQISALSPSGPVQGFVNWAARRRRKGRIAKSCQVPVEYLVRDISHFFELPVFHAVPVSAASLLTLVTTGLLHPLALGCHKNPSHSSGLPQGLSYSLSQKSLWGKKQIAFSYLYVESKIVEHRESRTVVTGGAEVGGIRRHWSKGTRLQLRGMNKSRDHDG